MGVPIVAGQGYPSAPPSGQSNSLCPFIVCKAVIIPSAPQAHTVAASSQAGDQRQRLAQRLPDRQRGKSSGRSKSQKRRDPQSQSGDLHPVHGRFLLQHGPQVFAVQSAWRKIAAIRLIRLQRRPRACRASRAGEEHCPPCRASLIRAARAGSWPVRAASRFVICRTILSFHIIIAHLPSPTRRKRPDVLLQQRQDFYCHLAQCAIMGII